MVVIFARSLVVMSEASQAQAITNVLGVGSLVVLLASRPGGPLQRLINWIKRRRNNDS